MQTALDELRALELLADDAALTAPLVPPTTESQSVRLSAPMLHALADVTARRPVVSLPESLIL